jgi:hypothetical protein
VPPPSGAPLTPLPPPTGLPPRTEPPLAGPPPLTVPPSRGGRRPARRRWRARGTRRRGP